MNKYARTPDHIIDLHGFTVREAEVILRDTLQNVSGKRVRIITGKCSFRGKEPVLKNFVSSLLQKEGISFRPAKREDGGDGAIEADL